MKILTDQQLRRSWAHRTTDQIRRMPEDNTRDRERVMAARARIIALREQDERDAREEF